MFKHKPRFVIFENVKNAPWAKMEEYMTGLVPCATVYEGVRGSKKAISKADSEAREEDGDAPKELTLVTTEARVWVVDEVPRSVGVRVGAEFLGVRLKPGTPLRTFKAKKGGGRVTLTALAKELKLDMSASSTAVLCFKTPCEYQTKYVVPSAKRMSDRLIRPR